jgi:hypothetical protein
LVPLWYALPMDPSYIPSCDSQFCVVVQGISSLIWRRLLVRSDMPLVTIHTMARATALGECISTGFVDSPVHQVIGKRFCERQQMQ